VLQNRVWDALFLANACESLNGVVETLKVLHVEGADDVDAGAEDLADIFEAFGTRRVA